MRMDIMLKKGIKPQEKKKRTERDYETARKQ